MKRSYFVLASLLLLFHFPLLHATITPIPLEQRAGHSEQIVLARLNHQFSYWGEGKKNMYTLYVLDVIAYLKGEGEALQVAVIAEGGRIGQKMQITFPQVHVDSQHEYVVFLNGDNAYLDFKDYRTLRPTLRQCRPHAGVQGLLKRQGGGYYDIGSQAYFTEPELFRKIEKQLGTKARTPEGEVFRRNTQVVQERGPLPITSITDGTLSTPASGFIAGTTLVNNELIINGSGFGTMPGVVFFSNADDGGATLIASTVPSDRVSWADGLIRVKIPDQAGTGTVLVQNSGGMDVGSTPITVEYAVIPINTSDLNFAEVTRVLPKLADINGSGGYTYLYNNDVPNTMDDFAGHADAVAAFERALNNWRVATGVNFDRDNSGAATDIADDGIQVVSFDNLPSGTLGATTLRIAGLGIDVTCDQEDTRWYIEDIDMQFKSNADLFSETGLNWNFDGDATTINEYDFESVALHELGHAHGLGHVIDGTNTEVMHYVLFNGEDLRTLSSSDTNGGDYLMSEGTATPPCLANNPFPMTAVAGPLPIELLAFEGRPQGNAVALNWRTATEANNDFFTLERSHDGRAFEPIAKISGAGNAAVEQHYHYLDKAPFAGSNYYRLSQTDFDGATTYEGIVFVRFDGSGKDRLAVGNPITGQSLVVFYQANVPGAASLHLYNLDGRVMAHWEKPAEHGANLWHLPVEQLAPGVYCLQLQQGHWVSSERVLKLR